MGLFASDVKIDPKVLGQTEDIGTASQNNLKAILGSLQEKFRKGQAASGRPNAAPNDYFSNQMDIASTRGNRNIANSLYGVLGNASYGDARALRTHNQNMELAKLQGELMKPSVLQEVLGGLNGTAPTIATAYGMYNNRPQPYPYRDLSTEISLYNPQGTGIDRYRGV